MKSLIAGIILIISTILLIVLIKSLDINSLKYKPGSVEFIGEKVLKLNSEREEISLPHLNIKGIVEEINQEEIAINLSEKSNNYLETNQIIIKNNNYDLNKNNIIFLKFNNIKIEKNNLYFSDVELYKLMNNIELKNKKNDSIICKNSYGNRMRINGETFEYEGNIYFLSDEKIDENNEIFFKNIINNYLLVEDYKSLRFPFKVYNMINPQETMFEEIIKIYKK